MKDKDLDTLFQEAYKKASHMTKLLPQDVMLTIYAYYKQATHGILDDKKTTCPSLRDAFKINAWMQVSHLSREEAKKLYIETINSLSKP